MATQLRAQRCRKLRVVACQACRSRRTRCDGQKPTCHSCQARRCACEYPEENQRTPTPIIVENELSRIQVQLDRIEHAVTVQPSGRGGVGSVSEASTSSWATQAGGFTVSTSPAFLESSGFPYMKLQTRAFTKMAGLGEEYGNRAIRLERNTSANPRSPGDMCLFEGYKVQAALKNYSTKIHPWYPILESRFSECISTFLASPSERSIDTFLVLMVLASGSIAQEETHVHALEERPDAMYLGAAMDILQLVVLEQSLRSVQCLVAASIHHSLLLKPLQAHDLAVMAIKKAQDLHISGAFQDDQAAYEHWIRVYRIALLIEGELVIPLRLADSNAWYIEDDIALPTGTDIWSFEQGFPMFRTGANETVKGNQSDNMITYQLAEISMRRLLRRNTAAITIPVDGKAEYAPLIAQELKVQLERWYSFLPEALRFSPEPEDFDAGTSSPRVFLRTQYWACRVSFYWPAVVQVMDLQQLNESTMIGCRNYFHSYRQFISSATRALEVCLPNKWTIYASIFAISIGAHLGASNALLAPLASKETWDILALARDSFGDECHCSPSLYMMRESIQEILV